MNLRNLSIMLVIMLFLSSCNLPTNAPPVTDEVTEPSPTLENTPLPPTATLTPIPSATPLPTDTPLPTPTGTPTVPIARVKNENVNCRLGYGTEWLPIGALLADQTATITGKNATSSWWYVTLPNSTQCWVAASVTNTAGNLAGLPIINQSTASVTKVTIEKPEDISVAGCVGPIQPLSLKGSIEMNGPGTASWHFDTEQSGTLVAHSTNFDTVGAKTVSDSFVPPVVAGSYWVKLVVTSPNGEVAESSYTIVCPP